MENIKPLTSDSVIDLQVKLINDNLKPADKICPNCLNTGVKMIANGQDDYDKEPCDHLGDN